MASRMEGGGIVVAKTKTSAAVKNRYAAKAYDRIALLVPKGQKATVERAAQTAGESVNLYTQKALLSRMGLDSWPELPDDLPQE